jgi:hypothetical protein
MHVIQLISIGLFTAAVVLTIYAWMDRVRYSNRYFKTTETFANPPDPLAVSEPIGTVPALVSQNPTNADAIAAHRLLLQYTSKNVANGLRFIKSIGNTFFKQPLDLRTDIDPANLMNNYVSPLQVV